MTKKSNETAVFTTERQVAEQLESFALEDGISIGNMTLVAAGYYCVARTLQEKGFRLYAIKDGNPDSRIKIDAKAYIRINKD